MSLPIEKAEFTQTPRGVFLFTFGDGTVMTVSQANIMAAFVMLWPCYTSLCTKLSYPIALVNSEQSST